MRGELYPAEAFFTGFAESARRINESVEIAGKRLQKEAQGLLVESIRIKVESSTKSTNSSRRINQSETLESSLKSEVSTEAGAEIIGIKTESYYDKSTNTVYAFAYANKYEVIGYYKANLSLQFQQAEGALKTAEQLEVSGEKVKARKQCDEVFPLLAKIRSAQDLLIVLDNTANSATLKVVETEQIYNSLTQMQARLVQATLFFVSGNEKLFGKIENIIANKVKADLAHKGCSFVKNVGQADFHLKITANVRLSSKVDDLVFCFADVEVDLFDNHKKKSVFSDEFSEKGGSNSQEKAGRKAMENAANKIVEKLKPWLE
jgi:hypothetical protein